MRQIRSEVLRCPECYMAWEAPVFALSNGEYFREEDLICPADDCDAEGEILSAGKSRANGTRLANAALRGARAT